MYKQKGKKEPSVRWLRVGIENSNNFSLKKSTLDTLLLRTYKQTELLCTHINKCHSVRLWLSPCKALGSHARLYRTQQVSETWDLSVLGLSHLVCMGWTRAREKLQFRSGWGAPGLKAKPSTSVWTICLLSSHSSGTQCYRYLLYPDIAHPT